MYVCVYTFINAHVCTIIRVYVYKCTRIHNTSIRICICICVCNIKYTYIYIYICIGVISVLTDGERWVEWIIRAQYESELRSDQFEAWTGTVFIIDMKVPGESLSTSRTSQVVWEISRLVSIYHRRTYKYMYIYLYTYTQNTYTCMHIFIYIHIYIHIYRCIYIYIHVYICVCIYIHMYTYMNIYIYTYMHINVHVHIFTCLCVIIFFTGGPCDHGIKRTCSATTRHYQ